MTMGIYVSLVDKLNTPSPLISNYMSYSGRTSVVTAVYLPGNALSETVGLESTSSIRMIWSAISRLSLGSV
jgi:hypothetical protein